MYRDLDQYCKAVGGPGGLICYASREAIEAALRTNPPDPGETPEIFPCHCGHWHVEMKEST